MTASTTRLRWPLERVLFALAGTMTLISAALAATVSPWFLLLTAFVGINQWLYVTIGACPASVVLGRLLGLQPCTSTATPDARGEARRWLS
ncbi:MAG: DUF2892 domain-containing protein [Acidimicrobiales bacterium]